MAQLKYWDGSAWQIAAVGVDGEGVPIGGDAGQILAKNSSTNYDTAWITQSGPYAMAANTIASFTASASVTFPSGRFTQAPIVTATMASSSTVTSATVGSVTTSGFTIYAWTGGSASGTGRTAYYQAIQMTSGAAGG